MTDLSHVSADGSARMVDVSAKAPTVREAVAQGTISMTAATLTAIRENSLAKGDVLSVARIAGVMAAKRTAELIPLCHPVALTDVDVQLDPDDAIPGIRVTATARALDRTGVEMEAMVAVTIALVTIYDMAKAADRAMTIGDVHLLSKSGGRSGDWKRT